MRKSRRETAVWSDTGILGQVSLLRDTSESQSCSLEVKSGSDKSAGQDLLLFTLEKAVVS